MKIILVRHGETQWNTTGRFGGHSDVPLNEKGKNQAEAAGQKLKSNTFDRVYCSDLSRAVDTAAAIIKHHDINVKYTPTIREMYFGKWEGLTYKEILKSYPEQSKEWVKDFTNVACLEGESMKTFYDRIAQAFDEIKSEAKDDETILVVAHSGVIRSILTKELLGSIDGYWKFKIDNGSIAILEYDKEFPILVGLNM